MAQSNLPLEYAHFGQLPILGGVEMLQARYQHMRFPKHIHETYCIAVIEEGAQRFSRTGQQHVAPKGDLLIVNAEDVHATDEVKADEGWGYQAIYPLPSLLKTLSAGVCSEAGTQPWFSQAVLHDPALAQQFRWAFLLQGQEKNTLLKETALSTALVQLMLRHARFVSAQPLLPISQQAVLRVQEYLHVDPTRDVSLTELAELAQLSPWHFLRQFKRVVGMTPHAYLLQLRIRCARAALQAGKPIALVAQQCGFTDQSHLNRHFKKTVGVTPGAFAAGLSKRRLAAAHVC
ncbi:MAG: AraC family transcriptional regulator [Neisseriaceae bacterium]|nr:AraC family transcriptional regulator [Neisseriaceae bacterium]